MIQVAICLVSSVSMSVPLCTVCNYNSYHVTIAINAVSGQECTGAVTAGSLSHDSKLVIVHKTYILAGYAVPCDGTVVAWEFCYRIFGASATFYPGIWRITGTNRSDTYYELVQSNTVVYDHSIRTDGDDSCQRVNLSITDQFTAPAGSVVGLYSNIETSLLRTDNDSSVATYQSNGSQNSVSITGNSNDVNYSIAIKVHLGKYMQWKKYDIKVDGL